MRLLCHTFVFIIFYPVTLQIYTTLISFNQVQTWTMKCTVYSSCILYWLWFVCDSQVRKWLSASPSCCLWLCSCWSSWSWSPPPPALYRSLGSTCSSPWYSSLPPSSSLSSSSTPTTAPRALTQCQTGSARWDDLDHLDFPSFTEQSLIFSLCITLPSSGSNQNIIVFY